MERVYWGNTVWQYLVALGGILLAWVILQLIRKKLISLLKKLTEKTSNNFDDILIKGLDRFVIPYIYLLVNYSIISQLTISPRLENILGVAMVFITTYYVVRIINFAIHGAVQVYMYQKGEPEERVKQLSGMLLVVKALVWIIGIIMLLDNLGYDVTTIIAGLGVGGIAIALAAQNILSDLFSYFVIFFDKPFEVGDYIVAGDKSGVVEKIGIKTSHVRSLDGQQLIMPNAEMVKSVIQNFKRLERRRVVFSIGVVYNTPVGKLKRIPEIVRELISGLDQVSFDRAHLKTLADFSINFEIVYYINSPEYLLYMDKHHAVCMGLVERFEQEGIEFAFPTQTLFVKKDETAG